MENYSMSQDFGIHSVQIKLQEHDYTLVVFIEVGGNCRGFSVMESAINMFLESIEEGNYGENLILINSKQEKLLIDINDFDRYDIEKMIVEVSIVSYVKEKDKAEITAIEDVCLNCGSKDTGSSDTKWWCNNCGVVEPCPCCQGKHQECIDNQNTVRIKNGLETIDKCCCETV